MRWVSYPISVAHSNDDDDDDDNDNDDDNDAVVDDDDDDIHPAGDEHYLPGF